MNHGKKVLNKEQIVRTVERMLLKKKTTKITIHKFVIQSQQISAIEYKNLIKLSLFSLNTRRDLVKRFLLRAFKDSLIMTADGIEIRMSERSASKVSRLTHNHQQEIALYSENLIQIARYKNAEKSRK